MFKYCELMVQLQFEHSLLYFQSKLPLYFGANAKIIKQLSRIAFKMRLLYLFVNSQISHKQYSCLENPMAGGAQQAIVHVVAKSQTQLSNLKKKKNCLLFFSLSVKHLEYICSYTISTRQDHEANYTLDMYFFGT